MAPIVVLGFILLLNRNLGWLPNDDGTLMQTALRIGGGEVPHVDFHEPYTGGLGYLNAGVLAVFGENMASLRWPFVIAAFLWAVSLCLVARRFMPPVPASLLVASLGFGSVLLHMSPIPSWYNLFLGTWSIHLTIKYLETNRSKFLVGSGALIGISILLKTTGIYFGMAVWVILLVAVAAKSDSSRRRVGLLLSSLPIVVSVFIVSADLTLSRLIGLIFPIAVVVGLSIWIAARSEYEGQFGIGPSKPAAIILASSLAAPALWFASYSVRGYGSVLIESLYAVPSTFIDELSLDNPHPLFLLVPACVVISFRILKDLPSRGLWLAAVVFVGGFGVIYQTQRSSILIWALTGISSLSVVAAILFWVHMRSVDLADAADSALLAVTCGAVFFALIEFPHAGPYFYIYAFPLSAVATAGWAYRSGSEYGHLTVTLLIVICILFGVNKLNGSWFADATTGVERPHVSVELERLGLRIPVHYQFYEDLIADIDRQVDEGGDMLAGPDSPEIYALAKADNPTPVFFELISRSIDPVYSSVSLLRARRPDIYVLNSNPVTVKDVGALRAALAECELQQTYGFYELYSCDWGSN